jgi:hypothetical protein
MVPAAWHADVAGLRTAERRPRAAQKLSKGCSLIGAWTGLFFAPSPEGRVAIARSSGQTPAEGGHEVARSHAQP